MKRLLTVFLAACLMISAVAPAVYATEVDTPTQTTETTQETTLAETSETTETSEETSETTEASEETSETTEASKATETSESVTTKEEENEVAGDEPTGPKVPELPKKEETKLTSALKSGGANQELSVKDYATFVANLKVLEGYAKTYAASNTANDANELILNFIRTGVDRYNDGNWKTLAGEEITGFTSYVEAQDAANNTTVMCLRDIVIDDFKLPNGNQVDFGHMFGTMNIAYISAQASADLGGWAGDICDLLLYSKFFGNVPAGTVDEQAAYILENCFGVNADDAFGMDDFYGDMDALYLIDRMKAGKTLSAEMEAYFTESLSDRDRSEYFMKNRFENLYTQESVREAVYNAYKGNIGIQVLEAGRELTDVAELRQACCYAFADYVYAQAGDTLEEPTEPDPSEPTEPGDNPYYSVFSSTTSNLAPGITQTIKYAYSADNKQMAYYLAEVDVTRDDVTIMAGYRDADPGKGWGMQRVTDQANAMVAKHTNPDDTENYIENFRAIVATNGAGFNMSTGEPGGLLVMNGKEWHAINNAGFFAIMKDGSAKIGTTAEYAACKDQVQEAIAGFGSVLIKDGEIVAANDGGRASRTAIGIKADGSVVMMVLDGRQEPFSCGGTMAEIAQIMKDAGCYNAINLDGGGSTTFAAKPEGSDEITVVNRPSDGYQRSVSTSLIAVSTAKTSNAFSHANITSEYDYLTIGTSLNMKAVGVSEAGGSATVPEGVTWQVSDETIGAITADGVFTAAANGDVEVQLVLGEEVIGKKTLHVVVPDALEFESASMNLVYGIPKNLGLQASYEQNPVAINENDVMIFLGDSDAGVLEGFVFTADEEVGIRSIVVAALLLADENVYAITELHMYRADEAFFDFENATSGNRTLAWLREVSNATTEDGILYHVITPDEDMSVKYTFGLDMTTIDIPPQLADLTHMLPGADQGKTAWDFLLGLAERVGELTEVKISVQLDPNVDVDISEINVSNEYFYLKNAEINDENILTVACGWIDQTQAIEIATANPICILSGIRMTPKNGAPWNEKNQLEVLNRGEVSYRIFLRASSLYSFANNAENQAKYGLVPYSGDQEEFYLNGEPLMYGKGPEQGAYFGTTYADFIDSFTLDRTNRNGWYTEDNQLYYYVNNKPVTGIHLLPGNEDAANKYYYEFDESGVCARTVSGLIELDGSVYYAIAGVPKTGWVAMPNGDYYYFHPTTMKAVDGIQTIDGYTYTFEDCKLVRGHLVYDSKGGRYRWAGQWASQEWLVIDGKTYYAERSAYFRTGIEVKRHPVTNELHLYVFDDKGVWLEDYGGFYDWNGKTYLIEDGWVVEYPGLVKIGEDYYYFCSNHSMVKDSYYWISKSNGIVKNGRYQIDKDGKVDLGDAIKPSEPTAPTNPTTPTTPTEPEEKLNGIVKESEDTWYYYVDGVKTYAGLIIIDGDYYYVNSSCKVIHGCDYWISKNNGYMRNKMYTFDADGKMVLDETGKPVEPTKPTTPTEPVEKLNGIVKESDDVWYYYVDGVKTYAGLIQIDGDFYYVNSKFQVIHGCEYWISKNNGYMRNKMYTFDADGKMVMDGTQQPLDPTGPTFPTEPQEKLNGIVKDGDIWFYYVDGELTYAGLIQIDGDFYYVNSKHQVVHDCEYWISKNNGYMRNKMYTFDADGKMVMDGTQQPLDPTGPTFPTEPQEKLNGIVKDGDIWYYYEDGVQTYAGLIIIDGYYYYVNSKYQVVHDCEYWISKNNGYMRNKMYTFDAEGRMVDVYPTV